MEIVQTFPDATCKVLPEESLTFSVSVRDYDGHTIEVWTDIPCEEMEHTTGGYAVPLAKTEEEGDISVFTGNITPTTTGFYEYSVRYRKRHWQWHGGSYEQRHRVKVYVEPAWITATIMYNAFVRHFGAQDRDDDGIILPGEGGTFADLTNRMDHFKQLGVNTIYLNPIQHAGEMFLKDETVAIHYQDETNKLPVHMHPGSVYSIKEYKSIDPELGLNEDDPISDQYTEFRRFVRACHEEGMRVILDIVFDHTAKDSFIQRIHPEWFMYKEDPNNTLSPFIYHGEPGWGEPKHTASPYDHEIFWSDCAQVNWEFNQPPAPNDPPRNPRLAEMQSYFKNVLKYWISEYGVDGFRLDVAYAVPTDFWHEALDDCREYARGICAMHKENPQSQPDAPLTADVVFIGETYVDKVVALQECGLTLLNGDFSSKLFSVEQLKGYLEYAYNISGRFFPLGSRWWHFPECHDFERLPGKFHGMLHHENADVQLNKSRWVLAALLPGVPMIHNGFEVVEHEPVSVRSYSGINWESKKNISAYLGKVNAIRNAHLAFQKGSYTFIESEQGSGGDAQLYSFVREYGGEKFLVIVNMDVNHAADHVQINLPDWLVADTYTLHDLLTDEKYERSNRSLTVVLPPGESHVFRVE